MNRVRKKLLQLSFLFTILVAGACNDPDEVGLGVQPEGNQPGVITIDVDSFTTYTVLEDSLVSSSTLSPLFLGTLYDIETGITAASFYAQVRLGGLITSSTFNDFTSADSVILSLGYIKNGIYGDTLSQHSISVYELNEALSTDSVYYSNRDFSLKSMIGHTEVVPKVNDSVPQMRMQLDNGFANDLVNRLKSTTPDNATLVKDVFKGIYVIDSASGTGSVVNLLSTSTINRLIIYYNDSLTF